MCVFGWLGLGSHLGSLELGSSSMCGAVLGSVRGSGYPPALII